MSPLKKTIEVSSNSFPVSQTLILKKIFLPIVLLVVVVYFVKDYFINVYGLMIFCSVFIIVLALFEYAYVKVLYYRLEDHYVLIKRNAIFPKEFVIEYIHIKDIVVYRDTLDKLFGLYQLHFITEMPAPSAKNMALIEGLDKVEAHELKQVLNHLTERVKKS